MKRAPIAALLILAVETSADELVERSAREARLTLERGIEAAGGQDALRGLLDISRTLEGFRVEVGQSHRPDAYTRQPVRVRSILDFKGGRTVEEQQTSIIGGLQIDSVYVNRDGGGFSLDRTSMIRRPMTPAAGSRSRGTPNRYPELLLRVASSQLASLRSLGDDVHDGEPQRVIALADPFGNQLTLYFSAASGLLTKSVTLVDEPVFSLSGLRAREHVFSDYRDVGRIKTPFRFVTRYMGELLEDLTAKDVQLDTRPADSTFEQPSGYAEPDAQPARGSTTRLADGVYAFHGGYNSLLVELEDHVLVVEAPLNDGVSQLALAKAKELFPGKPLRYVVTTHFHRDHIGGLRAYAAAGATIVTVPHAKLEIEKLLRAERPVVPETLPRPASAMIETVAGIRRLGDARRTLELHDIGPNPHVAQMLIAWLPKEKVLYVADVLDINSGPPPRAPDDMAAFAAKLEELKLAPEVVVPAHGAVGGLDYLRKALAKRR